MDNIRNKSKEELVQELQEAISAYDSLQVLYLKEKEEKRKNQTISASGKVLSESMFQEHNSVMLLVDPLSGKIIDANKSALQFYNYPIDQLIGLPIDAINVISHDQVENEKEIAINQEQKLVIFQHRISSGEIRQVEVHSSPVEMNGEKVLFSIIHDVTEREALDSKLKNSEDTLRKAEEIGKFGNWYFFLNEKLLKASEGARIIYGFGREELSYEEVKDMAISEYRPMLNIALSDLVLNGKQYDVEYKIKRKSDGKIVDIHSIAEFDPIKKIVFGTIQDISERKRIEEAMIESEDKFYSLFANMIEGAALHKLLYNKQGDPDDYVIIEANPALEVHLGISKEKVINKTSREAYGVDDPPFIDIYAKVALSGEPVVFETYFPPLAKYFSISVYSPYKGTFATIFVDITERKKAEHTIRESERRYHGLLDHLDAGIVVHAADTSIIMANPKAQELFGLKEEQLTGKLAVDPLWKFLLGDLSPMPLEEYPVNKIISSKKPLKDFLMGVHRAATGDVVWLLVNGLPTLNEYGGINEVLISFTDITERKSIEDNLRESQLLLREAQRLAQIGVWNWDDNTTTVSWSEELCKIVGRDPNLPVPAFKDQQFVFTPESYKQFAAAIENVKETGRKNEVELEVVHADGSLRNVIGFVGMKYDTKGRIKGLYGTLQDITGRKRMELALAEREELYRLLFENSGEAILYTQPDGAITSANPEACRIFGRSEEEISKSGRSGLMDTTDPRLPDALEKRRKTGQFKGELNMLRNDGAVFPAEVSSTTFKDSRGVEKTSTIIRDITERKLAEEALRETNAYLENLLNYANAPIIVWDPQFRITRFNHAFELLTGRWEADVLGKSLNILFPPELAERSTELIRKTLSGERWEAVEIKILNNDDSVRTVLWNSATLFGKDGKTPVATIAQGQDITERMLAEEAVHRSEELLNRTQKIANLGSWELDIESGQLIWSDEVYKIFGFSPQEFPATYNAFLEALHPDDRERVDEAYSGSIANNKDSYEIKHRVIRKTTGEQRFVYEKCEHIRNASGKIVRSVGSILDITKSIQAEEALRESKHRLNQMLQSTDQGIYGIGMDGCCTFINHSGTSILGYTVEECIGRNMHDLIHHSHTDGSTYVENECPIFKVKNTGKGSNIEDEVFWRKDGTPFPVEYSSYPTFEKGIISGAVVTFADITKRKQIEAALRESEERFRKMADLLPQVIFEADVNGNFTYVNRQAYKLFGYPEDYPIVGVNAINFHAPEDKTRAEENIKDRISDKPVENNEYKMQRKDGSAFQALVYSNPIIKNNKAVGLRGIIIDISDRKRVEEEISTKNKELLSLVAQKDRFFSIIAHDLRSPFNGFLGLTQIMAEKLPELTMDEIQKIAVSMRSSATSLFRLLENLLYWARIEQGLIPLNAKLIHLLPIVTESIAMSLEPANKKGIDLAFSIPEELEVFADTNMLQTIIRNLVSNAVKFTKPGGKIRLSAKANTAKSVEIAIQDTGIGMSKDILDNLFHINLQTNRKGTEGEPSTGLGLIICREFIEKHGGRLHVESEAGKGSTFSFILPEPTNPSGYVVNEATDTAEEKPVKAQKLKILIAEDDETSEMLISIALKSFSYMILKVKTGYDAVEACRNNPEIDLIMMDLKMPGMDGYEATRQIRKFNKKVFIVAQTAFGNTGDREKAISEGFNDFISKPLSIFLLKELILKNFTVSE